tara:strand:+ start:305 stop:1063 length:759 start_codon:yes stop_codon:yes gene_type:complete
MKHISYSELKIWAECPYKHKLMYVDRVKKFVGNEFTAFGRAIHEVCEYDIVGLLDDPEEFFNLIFEKELSAIKLEENKLITEMRSQAKGLIPHIVPEVKKTFGEYEVFSIEEKLYEDINDVDLDYKMKGFIDLVLKTEDGKYHIIDWKSCSWGWNAEKRSSRMITYQLTLYKKFFCQKHKIDPKLVETHFALLKRTAKKDCVEIFRVTSGPKKTQNATDLLVRALKHISKKNYVKDRRSCNRCEFYKTENCK